MAHKYKKYTHLEHILARPDTYVGSLIPDVSKQWIFENADEPRATLKQVTHVGGLFKIFDEILVNAVDQCVLPDNRVDKITVDVNVQENSVSVMNTGNGVPVEQHPDHDNVWVPELIFGELLTSSNYNDDEARTTGGRNGYGAKLANVFSKRFQVDTVCTRNKKRYVQEWEENMTTKKKAKITAKTTGNNGYTRITFWPDLERFGLKTLDQDDIVSLFERRTYDICACTPGNVKVAYNGKSLGIKTFDKYVDCYIGNKSESKRVYERSEDGRWEIALAQSDQGFQQVSFVNGIHTSIGGTHVEYVSSQLVKRITEHILSKHKDLKVKPQQIKEHLFLFVKSTLTNPTFSSQTKTECTSRWKDFGTMYRVSDEFVKKTVKLPFIDEIVSLVKHRESRELNKTDGRKLSVIKGIPKLEDANKAGTTQSSRCTLILTEGDSAKTFAISGLSVVGRDHYGVFPLKGKLLNVRDATTKQLMNNEEIVNIKQILGLQNNKEYTSTRDLRYGKVLILTDADVDGSHIKGLFINFVHHFWPSLLESVPDFLMSMRTPILKASKARNVLSFYTKQEYDEWKRTADYRSWTVKYYKGLGTSTAQEARDYFRDFERCKITYAYDKAHQSDIELAFKKTLTNERKTWIQEGCVSKATLGAENTVNVSDFIHKDLRWFSIADNERSIPNVMDGLKPSQRKVLYALRKRAKGDIKVSQLSGYVSTETCYHHGEQSLMGTIVNMAQDYVGSNNINLLQPKGQFGTRLMGGKDAASPRYIFTQLSDVTERLFDALDDATLEYLEDDGTKIEPVYFVPVLPMVLINGADGIGTGYSTQVPCYSPKDVEDNVRRCLNNEPQVPMTPWYRGFKGSVVKGASEGRFTTHGVWTRGDSGSVIEITELPIGKWTSDYKEFLDGLLVADAIKGFENHSTETDVRFTIRLAKATSDEDIEKRFKLSSALSTSNMHLFDKDGCIVHYDTPEDIIEAFVRTRLVYYRLRKAHLLKTYRATHYELSEKIRFINLVINEDIRVFRKTREYITKAMSTHGFDPSVHETLLGIRISAFTEDQIRTLQGKVDEFAALIHTLDGKTHKQLWIEDLRK